MPVEEALEVIEWLEDLLRRHNYTHRTVDKLHNIARTIAGDKGEVTEEQRVRFVRHWTDTEEWRGRDVSGVTPVLPKLVGKYENPLKK